MPKLKVLKWRIRYKSRNLGVGDDLYDALADALGKMVAVSDRSELQVEVWVVKNGRSFWKPVESRELERVYESLEDKEKRRKWKKRGANFL